eukprot:CAMPEP_0119194710 /NCGR_PEP_ID=MMETSP1316-20130426/4401_1 /TAXON_ID=41880 /ORGANISM="Pycnococcus provasolii, Strain RCC2336" /LENGTH=43 /DNA_ID= /DNA_START= /DNA_END= /DNA_ORIENTATION=
MTSAKVRAHDEEERAAADEHSNLVCELQARVHGASARLVAVMR